MGRGKPRRAGADDRYFFRMHHLRHFGEDIDGIARFGPVALGDESFERADRDRRVELSAAARRFAGVAADAAANGSEGVGDPGVAVGFLVASLGDQGDVSPCLGVDRTGLHAGEIGLQPVEVHEFCARAHDGGFGCPLPRSFYYFFTVRSTVVVAAETVTACVVGLPSSLQVLRVYWPGGTFLISKLPALSVTAKYGVGTTTTYPDISGCTLQSKEAVPR